MKTVRLGRAALTRWLGVAAVLPVCVAFPDPADDQHRGRRVPDAGWRVHAREHRGLFTPSIIAAYWISIKISFWSALLGCLIGFAMAAAVMFGGLPSWIRWPLLTFSGVASNFAGVPLAFAFLATLGPVGLVTVWLRTEFGINLRAHRLQPLCLLGPDRHLSLLPDPADDPDHHAGARRPEAGMEGGGLDPRRDSAAVLAHGGASRSCCPRSSARFALLFANAFGAVATAIALTGSSLIIVPILLFAQIRGDVLGNPTSAMRWPSA